MDIVDLRAVATVFVAIGFSAVLIWVYLIKKPSDYDKAANLPFADEELDKKTRSESQSNE